MRTTLLGIAASLSLTLVVGCSASPDDENVGFTADALSRSTVSSIALANVGKGACSRNSAGGSDFDSSCTGNGGRPEYWCADFARWVWGRAGANTAGLTAAAGSFYVYGLNHGTLHSHPSIGDAVVFDYRGGGVADHVAIVTSVNSNGTIETVSGDWGGESGSEATFSSTSHADHNTPAYWSGVGSRPAIMGMTISGFISPAGASSAGVECTEGPGYCTATSQCEDGHWVPRESDPTACTSGPGASTSNACSEGPGYCTASSQCESGHWVPRASDPAACTSGPG